jgi:glycosyltransferase involved in cell wall biosynthesis
VSKILIISDQAPNIIHGTSLTYSKLMSENIFKGRYHFYTKMNNFSNFEKMTIKDFKYRTPKNKILRSIKNFPLLFDILNSLRIAFNMLKYAKEIKSHHFDHVYFPISSLNSIVGFYIIRIISPKSKTIIHFYDDPFRYIKRSRFTRRLIYKKALKFVCKHAGYIFSISQKMSDEVKLFSSRESHIFSCPIPDDIIKKEALSNQNAKLIINLTGSVSNKWKFDFVELFKFFSKKIDLSKYNISFNYIGNIENFHSILQEIPKEIQIHISNQTEEEFQNQTILNNECFLIISGFNQFAVESARSSFFTKIPYLCQYGIPILLVCPDELYISESSKKYKWAYQTEKHELAFTFCQSLIEKGDVNLLGESAYSFALQYRKSDVEKRLRSVLKISEPMP